MAQTIDEIMTRRVVTVGMDATLGSIRSVFDRYQFHHLLVVEDGRLAGVISDRDLLKHLSPFVGKMAEQARDLASLKRRAHQIMSRKLVTATGATTVAEAGQLMLNRGVSCLPVVGAHAGPVGIVTWRDLLRAALNAADAGTATLDQPDPADADRPDTRTDGADAGPAEAA